MEIKISDNSLGECVITPYHKIGKDEEYVIKSLAILQIMCMNSEQDREGFGKFINILKDAVQKIENIYADNADNKETNEVDNEFRANSQF